MAVLAIRFNLVFTPELRFVTGRHNFQGNLLSNKYNNNQAQYVDQEGYHCMPTALLRYRLCITVIDYKNKNFCEH